MTQDESAKTKAQKHNSKLMLVRYGKMGLLGWFEHNEPQIPKNKQYVIVKTDRGLELGQLVGPYNYKAGNYRFTPEQVEAYYTQGNKDISITTGGRFVRLHPRGHPGTGTPGGIRHRRGQMLPAVCRRARPEYEDYRGRTSIWGRTHSFFIYTSDGRVDFRELVKKLARESRPESNFDKSAPAMRHGWSVIMKAADLNAAASGF